jgi:dTDP-4-amino-4,6-dideoxygalactose transaminase
LHNLRRIDDILALRQEKAHCFRKRIHQETSFRVADWPDDVIHTFKDFTILVGSQYEHAVRNEVMRSLGERGIETRAYFYPPVPEQEYFRHFADRPLPKTASLARRVVTLPFYTSMTHDEMDYIVEALQNVERELL